MLHFKLNVVKKSIHALNIKFLAKRAVHKINKNYYKKQLIINMSSVISKATSKPKMKILPKSTQFTTETFKNNLAMKIRFLRY